MTDYKYEKICRKYWDIRERVQREPEYARLQQDLEALTAQYEAALEKLPADDRELIERYILLRESMNSWTLEWACGNLRAPKK